MNMTLIEKHTINKNQPLKFALTRLNEIPDNLTLFVLDEHAKVIGTLTDGDIRRGLLKGYGVDEPVKNFMFSQFKYIIQHNFTLDQVKELKAKRIKMVPVVDTDMHIIRLVDLGKLKSLLPLDVIIMAGGRGERLKPLTDTTPKPLLTVGSKPILEHNLRHLASYGINNFFITINYLGQMIIDYFGDGSTLDIDIEYIKENQPLGTLGAASLIGNLKHENVLVMNADVLTNIDIEDFFSEFIEEQSLMSVASVPYKVNMPFAVLETAENRVLSFSEKPEYTYYTNAGIYLLKQDLLSRIPRNKMYHSTDLMQDVLDKGEKLTRYSMHGFWMDIGRKEDYYKAQQEIKHLYNK